MAQRRIVRTKALSPPSVPRAGGGSRPGPPWPSPISLRHPSSEGERHTFGRRSPSGCQGCCSRRGAQSRSDRGVAAGGGDRSVREGYTMAAGAGAAGPGGSVECARARWARMVRTTTESCTVAMTRSRPPQRGDGNTLHPIVSAMYIHCVVQTQLYLDDTIHRRLRELARKHGRTISDLVRDALVRAYGAGADERAATLRGIQGLWRDRTDLGEPRGFVRRLRRDTHRLRRRRA